MTHTRFRFATCAALAAALAFTGAAPLLAQSIYNQHVLADNPIYYWTFDEVSGNALNLGSAGSVGGNNDFIFGAAAGRTAGTVSGGGINLGSAADVVQAAGTTGMLLSNGALTGPSGYTKYAIETWIRHDGSAQTYHLDHFTNQPALISNFVGSQFELFGGGIRTSAAGTGPTLPVGSWAHVVVGVDAVAGTHEIYVDGALAGTYANARTWGGPSTLSLGGTAFGGGLQDSNSDYDELAVYNLSGLSSGANFTAAVSDIADHFNATTSPTPALSYSYPGQQARADLTPVYADADGNQLIDGIVPVSSFASGEWAGFNELGLDNGAPQPRIDFDLGGTFDLDSVSVTYVAGGLAGILGPDSLDIYFSTDDGETYSLVPDATYAGFDQTSNGTEFSATDLIPLVGADGITNVRLDFFQGNAPGNAFSEWIFLGEIEFAGTPTSVVPEPAGIVLWSILGSLAFGFVIWRRQRGAAA